jgi:hypothetical protein
MAAIQDDGLAMQPGIVSIKANQSKDDWVPVWLAGSA